LKIRQTDFGVKDYETLALPLSYAGKIGKNKALYVTDGFEGLSSNERVTQNKAICRSCAKVERASRFAKPDSRRPPISLKN